MPPTLQQHSSNHHYPATEQTNLQHQPSHHLKISTATKHPYPNAFHSLSIPAEQHNAALRSAQQPPNNPNNLRILAQNAQCALLAQPTTRKSIVAQRIQSQQRFQQRPKRRSTETKKRITSTSPCRRSLIKMRNCPQNDQNE